MKRKIEAVEFPSWVGPALQALILEIRAMVGGDRDCLIIITGAERSGKSTLFHWLARLIDPTFDCERMVFTTSDLIQLSNQLNPGQVLGMDEAIDGGYSRDAMKEANRTLTKHFVISGALNLISFVLFPNIRWLDKYLAEHRAALWFHVERRGVCLVHAIRRATYRGGKSSWVQKFRFRYPAADAPRLKGERLEAWKGRCRDWRKYLKRKDNLIRGAGERQAGQEGPWMPERGELDGVKQLLRPLV